MEATEKIWDARQAKSAQLITGWICWLATALPFARKVRGLEKISPQRRCLFVANHVSLIDAVMLGGLFTQRGHGPVLILADKNVWDAGWVRRWLSKRFGFVVERGKVNPSLIKDLQAFGGAAQHYHLLVFPEGTRGNGVDVAECQPGVFYIAQAAKVPIVPIFLENMQCVSTKTGKFHLLGGLRKVTINFGDPIAPENYLSITREEFPEFIRKKILASRP
jgi:1-acyl-sn-glycerol-3-phosphate acyltransferase